MLEFLEWETLEDDDDNLYFEANSPYYHDGVFFKWRLCQRLTRNKIVWYCEHDAELGGDCGVEWLNLAAAQAEVLEAHNHILRCEFTEDEKEYEDRDEKQLKER